MQLNHPPNPPPTLCAFHPTQAISHFCPSTCCLLPLCGTCLPIHRKQHANLPEPMAPQAIGQASYLVYEEMKHECSRIEKVYSRAVEMWRNSAEHGEKLKVHVINQRQQSMQLLKKHYDKAYMDLEEKLSHHHQWMAVFSGNFHMLMQQLSATIQSLSSGKHLRSLIMWKRLNPKELLNNLAHTVPNFPAPTSSYSVVHVALAGWLDGQSQNLQKQNRAATGELSVKMSNLAELIRSVRLGVQNKKDDPSFDNSETKIKLSLRSEDRQNGNQAKSGLFQGKSSGVFNSKKHVKKLSVTKSMERL